MPLKLKKRKRRRYPKKANSAQHFKDWATIGREVTVNGKDLRVYSRSKLADAFANAGIPRTSTCLRLWEREGVLPRTPIVIGGKYFYTQGMIETIILTCIECGVGTKLISKDYLKERLWKEFNRQVEKELFE